MVDTSPRVVLLGNTAPISSKRETQPIGDVNLDELRERHDDPDDPLQRLVIDEDRGLVGWHERERLEGVSVTRFVPPESMGRTEAVSTLLQVYASDHSDDPPEWVWCDADPRIAEDVADHFTRQGHSCEVGIPDDWERKRSLNPAGRRMLLEAQDRLDEVEHPPIGGGSYGTSFAPEEFSEEFAWREHELRTNAGADFQSRVMGDTASNGTGSYAAANYIALSTDATAPAAGDTTLTSELSGSGLQRQQAAYAHTGGATTYTLTKAFTSSDGTNRTINKVGVFNASSTGTLVFETAVPSPPTLVNGDSLTITETVSI